MATPLSIRPLLAAVKERLEELTEELLLAHREGDPGPPEVYTYRLPNTARADVEVDICPFLVAVPLGGGDGLADGTARVRVVAAIYNPGDNGEGDDDIEALTAVILRLSENQNFNPHYLEGGMTFILGDPETGAQNHPVYYTAVDLTFVREPVYLNN